jgi:hypothetical protein
LTKPVMRFLLKAHNSKVNTPLLITEIWTS